MMTITTINPIALETPMIKTVSSLLEDEALLAVNDVVSVVVGVVVLVFDVVAEGVVVEAVVVHCVVAVTIGVVNVVVGDVVMVVGADVVGTVALGVVVVVAKWKIITAMFTKIYIYICK